MNKIKSFGKKSLSMFLAVLMCLSCMTVGFLSVSAYDSNQVSSETKYGKNDIKYNNLDQAVYDDEQIATALLDFLDGMLADLNIKTSIDVTVMTINIDLTSVNALFGTINALNGQLTPALKNMLGSLKQLNLSATGGISRQNTSSIEIIQALVQLIQDNRELIRQFLSGKMDLGVIVNGFLPGGNIYGMIGDLLGISFDRNNFVYTLVKPLMVKALYPNTSSAHYAAAMNKTLDNFVFEDLLDTAFNRVYENGVEIETGFPTIKYWDPRIDGWSLILPEFKIAQDDTIGNILYRAVSIAWDACLRPLMTTIAYEPTWFEFEEFDPTADGILDASTLFPRLVYDEATGSGVIRLNYTNSTILTDSSFDFSKYNSLTGGINDFLKYVLKYVFPNYTFNTEWASGGREKLIPNLVKLLGYVADSVDEDILAGIGGAENLNLNNMETAFLPFAKAIVKELVPVMHQDVLDGIHSFEDLAKQGAMVYAAQILPKNNYDNATYLDVVRDITAYQVGNVVPLYTKNSVNDPVHNGYDIYATQHNEEFWDVINYILCYYAEDRGLSNLGVNVNINRNNTLWGNLDQLANIVPVLKDLFADGGTISTEKLIKVDFIDNLMDGKVETILNMFLDMFDSPVSNQRILELIYNNIKAVVPAFFSNVGNKMPAYQSSPFDRLLQADVLVPVIDNVIGDIYTQRDNYWTPLMFLVQTVGKFVNGFLDDLNEQRASKTFISPEKANYTGTLTFNTKLYITNESIGNNRSYTTGVDADGTHNRLQDEKYKSKLQKLEIFYNGAPLQNAQCHINPGTELDSQATFDTNISGSIPEDGIVTIKLTYDVIGESGVRPIAEGKVATTFITLTNKTSYFDSVYSFNSDTSKYELKSNAPVNVYSDMGTNSGASFTMTVPQAFMLEADKMSESTADNIIKVQGTGYPTGADIGNVKSNIWGIYAVPYNTSSMQVRQEGKALVNRDSSNNWLDSNGNVILNAGSQVTKEAVTKCGNPTGIPGLYYSFTDANFFSNDPNYMQFIKWDGVTDVKPGKYDIACVLWAEGSPTLMKTTVYVADTNGYNNGVEDAEYQGRSQLEALYNEAFAVYNKYERNDFLNKEAWDSVEGLLTRTLTTVRTPLAIDNCLSLGDSYNDAYDALKAVFDALMDSIDPAIVEQIPNKTAKVYYEVDYDRVAHSNMNNKLNTLVALGEMGTASSFEIEVAIQQYELAVTRMIDLVRTPVTTKLAAEIARESKHNQADYAPSRWADYQKALADARTTIDNVKKGTALQNDVNEHMWALMMAEENLTLPEKMNYIITDIQVDSPELKFNVGDVVDKNALIKQYFTVNANCLDLEGNPIAPINVTNEDSLTISAIDTSSAGVKTATATYVDSEGNRFTATFNVTVIGATYTVKFYSASPEFDEFVGFAEVVAEYKVSAGSAVEDPYNDPNVKAMINDYLDMAYLFTDIEYKFVGWDKDFSKVTSDMVIYPIYQELTAEEVWYSINYNMGADETIVGECPQQFTVTETADGYVEEIQLPLAKKDGYLFKGWSTSEDLSVPAMALIALDYSADVTLYPVFEKEAPKGHTVSGYISGMTSEIDVVTDKQIVIGDATVTLYGDDGVTAVGGVDPIVNDQNGRFEFNGIADGTYVLAITGEAIITRTIIVTVNGADVAVSTISRMIGVINADLSNDGVIDVEDYTTFLGFMGTVPSSDNWNVNADLNNDKFVNIEDYTILLSFMGINSKNAYSEWVIE